MNKVQFFYNDDLITMERKINKWLAANKEVNIIETNLTAIGKPSQHAGIVTTEKYVFYIRYQVTDKQVAVAEEVAAELSSTSITETDPPIGLKIAKN